jgi:signal peptidase II
MTAAVASPRSGALAVVSLAIAVAVAVLDQITKHWALDALSGRGPRHVVWTLQWNLTFNSGMAFSRGQGAGPFIGALALVVVVVLVVSLRRSGSAVSAVAVGLVVGGAIGNLIDRLFRGDGWLRGSVVDFIDFQWFPIFNVADMGVTIGSALLLLFAAMHTKPAS